MIQRILGHILNAPAWTVYLTVGLLIFAEDALVCWLRPARGDRRGLGRCGASRGHVDLVAMCAIVVASAIIGHTVGYEVGRHFGPRILRVGILQRHQQRLGDAQAFLARRGDRRSSLVASWRSSAR